MTFADRVRAARAQWQPIVIDISAREVVCAMPDCGYVAHLDGNVVEIVRTDSGEMSRFRFETREGGRVALSGLGHWADLHAAARDLLLLSAAAGEPVDLQDEVAA